MAVRASREIVIEATPQAILAALAPDHAGDNTRVRFDITLEPIAPVPSFLMRRGERAVLSAATKGLRKRVLG
jgi:hypothetical protein